MIKYSPSPFCFSGFLQSSVKSSFHISSYILCIFMIFSWKIHGIQKEGTCHVWLFQYSSAQPSTSCILDIACKLGSMAKYENPMKNWLIIQLPKLLHVFLHNSVCSSNSPSIRLFICPTDSSSVHLSVRPSVCPSVCPSHIQIHGKLRQALNHANVANNVWGRIVSLMVIIHFEKCSDFSKKKYVVTIIGCGAKSSQRHRIWGMNVNNNNHNNNNKDDKQDGDDENNNTWCSDEVLQDRRVQDPTDGLTTKDGLTMLQTGSQWYLWAQVDTDGLMMLQTGPLCYTLVHDVTDGLTMLQMGSWCFKWAQDITDWLTMAHPDHTDWLTSIRMDSWAYRRSQGRIEGLTSV